MKRALIEQRGRSYRTNKRQRRKRKQENNNNSNAAMTPPYSTMNPPTSDEDNDDSPPTPATPLSCQDSNDVTEDWMVEHAIYLSNLCYRSQPPVDHKQKDDYKQKGVIVSNPLKPIPQTFHGRSTSERGESSTAFSTCAICKSGKPRGALLNSRCGHSYCTECIPVYLGEQINDLKDITKVKCPEPDCKLVFGYEGFQEYAPQEVMDRWRAAIKESSVLWYPLWVDCPFEGCGKSFVDDERGFEIRACPYCWRVFCLECGVKWHLGKSCVDFQAEELLRKRRELIQKLEQIRRQEEERRQQEEQQIQQQAEQVLDTCNELVQALLFGRSNSNPRKSIFDKY